MHHTIARADIRHTNFRFLIKHEIRFPIYILDGGRDKHPKDRILLDLSIAKLTSRNRILYNMQIDQVFYFALREIPYLAFSLTLQIVLHRIVIRSKNRISAPSI